MFNLQVQPRRVAIYIRVSTAEQQMEGYSLEAQKKRLLSYVNDNIGLNLTTKPEWFYSDTHTGSDMNRAGLESLMKAIREKKFDAVLVLKIDRLSRSLKHLLMIFEELEKHQVSLISMQENLDFRGPIGKLVFQIFGAIAQFERELIKGRTMMGKLASAEMGNYTGAHIPFGYISVRNPSGRGKKLEINPEEKQWVQKIYDWYNYEGLGSGQIADRLNDLGVKKGSEAMEHYKFSPWNERSVATILMSAIYRGEFIANQRDEMGNLLLEDKWTIVAVPACVSEITYMQAQYMRGKHLHAATGDLYLLSSKLIDMTLPRMRRFIGIRRQKGGISYRRKQVEIDGTYFPVFEIPGKQLEEWVWEQLRLAFKNPEVFIQRFLVSEKERDLQADKLESELAHLRSSHLNGELAMARIDQAYESGIYSEEKMKERARLQSEAMTKIDERIKEVEHELLKVSITDLEIKKLKDASESMKYNVDKVNRAQQKALCNICIDRVEMHRRRVNDKWQVDAKVCLRFNPEQLSEASLRVRTGQELTEEQRKDLDSKNDFSGGDGQNRTAV